MQTTENEILLEKNNIKLLKHAKNKFTLMFVLENKNIILSNAIGYDFIKPICYLNKDICENIQMQKVNDNEIILSMLFKHFFKDLGLPQFFIYFHVKKKTSGDNIIFNSQTLQSHTPDNVPIDSELVIVENGTIQCTIVSPHKINVVLDISVNILFDIPAFAENIVSLLVYKIIMRIKQFIENIRI